MYVNVAVLTETHPHECRVALVPSVVPKLLKLGARLHMQSGAGTARHLNGIAFKDVALLVDRTEWVKDADVGLGVKPPALEVVDAMKEDAILGCFIHANNEPELVKQLLQRKITCFEMERVPRIARAQAMDALSSQLALACYCAVQLGMSHLARVVPKITSAAGSIGPAHMLVLGLRVAGFEAISTAHRPAAWLRATTCGLKGRNRRFRWARPSSTPLSTRATKASQPTTATGGEPSFGKALRPTSGRSMTWIGSTCHCHEHADQTRTRPHVSAGGQVLRHTRSRASARSRNSYSTALPADVSLLFSRKHYLAAAGAYMRGIERRLAAGLHPKIASVASMFVSSGDVSVKEEMSPLFHNRLGIAVAMFAYLAHCELLASDRWQQLAEAGAKPQRLPWARTGTRDPAASDTLYGQALIAPETFNSLLVKTLLAVADHGVFCAAMPADGGYADAVLEEFTRQVVDDDALAQELQRDGVKAFAISWHAMHSYIGEESAP